MKIKFFAVIFILISYTVFSQNKISKKKWLRIGFIYGFSSQNTYLKQDSDYIYENSIYKISSHYNFLKKRNHRWELFVEPSYYRSEHKLVNYWFISHTVANGEELREEFMKLKSINEYVINIGIIYRYYFEPNFSVYALGNVGPMYIDTETERLQKGFAFSDIFALGGKYRVNKISFDVKCMIRHVSNANLQQPNFGLNAVGFEFGTYFELQ